MLRYRIPMAQLGAGGEVQREIQEKAAGKKLHHGDCLREGLLLWPGSQSITGICGS